MSSIAQRLSAVKARIEAAAIASERAPNSVRLIAVSKRMPPEALREAYAAGQRDFGENYVQELAQKAHDLATLPDLRLHLIGHLQTNKVRAIARLVSSIQSVDSVRLIEELGKRVSSPLPLLIEVNVANESQKSGCKPEEVSTLLEALKRYPQLHASGLMTVPPFSEDPKDARPHFDRLRVLRDQLGGVAMLPELSMGMTLDLEEAIAAGATIVRVGTAIFGERSVHEVQ